MQIHTSGEKDKIALDIHSWSIIILIYNFEIQIKGGNTNVPRLSNYLHTYCDVSGAHSRIN